MFLGFLAVGAKGKQSRSKILGGHFIIKLASFYGSLTLVIVAQLQEVCWMKLYNEHKLCMFGICGLNPVEQVMWVVPIAEGVVPPVAPAG